MTNLKPCPFCGSGETRIIENGRIWLGSRYGEPLSVSVRHFCPSIPGQPSRMIERIGRDQDSAIAAWNTRSEPEKLPRDIQLGAGIFRAGIPLETFLKAVERHTEYHYSELLKPPVEGFEL